MANESKLKKAYGFGFWAVPHAALDDKRLSPVECLLLGILFTRANVAWEAWPTQKYLSKTLGIGERSVRRYIEKLEKTGWISVDRRSDNRVNTYLLHHPESGGQNGHRTQLWPPNRTAVTSSSLYKNKQETSVAQARPSGKSKNDDEPMTRSEFVEWMRKSPQAHMRLIGEWADELKIELETKGQWGVFTRQNTKAAAQLAAFGEKKIERGADMMFNEANRIGFVPSNLNTLLKYVLKV